jgi:hypothetical protein
MRFNQASLATNKNKIIFYIEKTILFKSVNLMRKILKFIIKRLTYASKLCQKTSNLIL